jgi:hypothetical protein
MTGLVTQGVGETNLSIMIEALVRMKATLTRDAHPARRAAPPDAILPEAREAV